MIMKTKTKMNKGEIKMAVETYFSIEEVRKHLKFFLDNFGYDVEKILCNVIDFSRYHIKYGTELGDSLGWIIPEILKNDLFTNFYDYDCMKQSLWIDFRERVDENNEGVPCLNTIIVSLMIFDRSILHIEFISDGTWGPTDMDTGYFKSDDCIKKAYEIVAKHITGDPSLGAKAFEDHKYRNRPY